MIGTVVTNQRAQEFNKFLIQVHMYKGVVEFSSVRLEFARFGVCSSIVRMVGLFDYCYFFESKRSSTDKKTERQER